MSDEKPQTDTCPPRRDSDPSHGGTGVGTVGSLPSVADAYTRGWNDAKEAAATICTDKSGVAVAKANSLRTGPEATSLYGSSTGLLNAAIDIKSLTPKPSQESGS